MVILSLFDGISGARLALEKAGIPVAKYYSSEVDKHTLRIAKANFPDNIQLGDVRNITASMIPEKVDLIIGGSPCQDLSALNKNGLGLEGKKSSLFFEFVRLKNELKPKYFLLENGATMKNTDREIMADHLGVAPIKICASILSGQKRPRYYFTNITGITIPVNQGIYLKDIIEPGSYTEKSKASCITATYASSSVYNHFLRDERTRVWTIPVTADTFNFSGFTHATYTTPYDKYQIVYSKKEKYIDQKVRNYNTLEKLKKVTRKLTVQECEKLQGLPYKYCYHVSDRQQYKAVGNGFNIPMVGWILSFLPK